ncbi:hypothetical protein TNCV_2728881 [Trichonephila clavipes]|nr:hypothetical protein TNCV_2728881 [Trichonephila clavipes]
MLQISVAVCPVAGTLYCVISRLKKASEGGKALQKPAGGCGRNAKPLEDRYVALVAKRNINFTPGQIAANLATDTHISARAISLRLNQVGLYARKLVRCIPLQLRFHRERLRWCKEHVGWDHQNWSIAGMANQWHECH